MRKFLREWWVELLILLLVLTGVFLLLEQWDIRVTVYRWVMATFKGLGRWVGGVLEWFSASRSNFTLSDFVGWTLILGTGTLLAWRARWRFVRSGWYTAETCPRCGSDLHRIHRTGLDRALGTVFFLKFNRFRCAKADCGWEGLRQPIRSGRKRK